MTDDATHPGTGDVPDEIVRSIHIAATAETVFAFIQEPGWFINDGEYRPHEITRDGPVTRVVDPVHGSFQIATEVREPPHRIVFRWLAGGMGEIADAPNNTVEFSLRAEGPTKADGVKLTVRERGFARLSLDADVRRRNFEENSRGWEEQLEVARTLAEEGRD